MDHIVPPYWQEVINRQWADFHMPTTYAMQANEKVEIKFDKKQCKKCDSKLESIKDIYCEICKEEIEQEKTKT